MFERFFPDTTVSSTYAIDYEKLYEEGYREFSLILTIRLLNMERGNGRSKTIVSRLKKIGYECCP